MIDVDRKSEPAPASLSKGKNDGAVDVREALARVFLNKCYLCETKVSSGTISVDHRKPQGQSSEEDKYAWENLFPACNAEKVRAYESARAAPDADLEKELKSLFSRRAPYTMLVRSVFSHRSELRAFFD